MNKILTLSTVLSPKEKMCQCITVTNIKGNGPIEFSMPHYRHIWTHPFLNRTS